MQFAAYREVGYRAHGVTSRTSLIYGEVHYQLTGERRPMPTSLLSTWKQDAEGFYLAVSIGEYNRLHRLLKQVSSERI